MTNKEIAKTILNQMRCIDKNLMMCMGFNKPMIIENGLTFKVNGRKHKGNVNIVLDRGRDTYNIYLCKVKRTLNKEHSELFGKRVYNKQYITAHTFTDVHVEDMMPILESSVE